MQWLDGLTSRQIQFKIISSLVIYQGLTRCGPSGSRGSGPRVFVSEPLSAIDAQNWNWNCVQVMGRLRLEGSHLVFLSACLLSCSWLSQCPLQQQGSIIVASGLQSSLYSSHPGSDPAGVKIPLHFTAFLPCEGTSQSWWRNSSVVNNLVVPYWP